MFEPLIRKIKYGGDNPFTSKNQFKFCLFDYEASLGKTYTYERALVELFKNEHMIDWDKDTSLDKSLIVIKTMEEGATVEREINELAGQTIAVAVNGTRGLNGNKSFEWDDESQILEMKKYQIVIITQQK